MKSSSIRKVLSDYLRAKYQEIIRTLFFRSRSFHFFKWAFPSLIHGMV